MAKHLSGRGKSLTKAYLLLLLGLHYAYLGRPWMTFLYIGTIGGCGFWFLLDLFRMPYLLDMYYIYLPIKSFVRFQRRCVPEKPMSWIIPVDDFQTILTRQKRSDNIKCI